MQGRAYRPATRETRSAVSVLTSSSPFHMYASHTDRVWGRAGVRVPERPGHAAGMPIPHAAQGLGAK